MSIRLRSTLLSAAAIVAVIAVAGVKAAPAETPQVFVDGAYLQAFNVAYADFRGIRDLPVAKKNLSRYSVVFRGSGVRIDVIFIPQFPKGWFGVGGESPYGRSVGYTIDTAKMKVIQRSFGE